MSLSGRKEEKKVFREQEKIPKDMEIFPLHFKLSMLEFVSGCITLTSPALSALPWTNKSLLCSEYMKNETCNHAIVRNVQGTDNYLLWLDHVGFDGSRVRGRAQFMESTYPLHSFWPQWNNWLPLFDNTVTLLILHKSFLMWW